MSAPRFYCPPPLPLNTNYELPPEAAHHASRVLRLRVGDAVQIFDGMGNALDATINSIQGKHVVLGNLQTCHRTTGIRSADRAGTGDVQQRQDGLGGAESHRTRRCRDRAGANATQRGQACRRPRRKAHRTLAQCHRLRLRAMRPQLPAAAQRGARSRASG